MTAARHRKLDQLERELHARMTPDEVTAELHRALTEAAEITADALDRGDRAQVHADLCFARETKTQFDSYAPWPGDYAAFWAEFHPDRARHGALAAAYRALQARPTSDTKD